MSNRYNNVPHSIELEDFEAFSLAFLCDVLDLFPSDLDEGARFSPGIIKKAVATQRLSIEGLLAAAYFGFMPLWSNYSHFQATAKRLNKFEPHAHTVAFRKDAVARENSATSEWHMSRGELKRLLLALDEAAISAGFSSFQDIHRCDNDVLSDSSPYCPIDRAAYALGPRYLWDFAKRINTSGRTDLALETCGSWVLVLHLEDDRVLGYALPPVGLRIGDFQDNGFTHPDDIRARCQSEEPIIPAPSEVLTALSNLAETRFPERVFVYNPMPSVSDVMVKRMLIASTSPYAEEA